MKKKIDNFTITETFDKLVVDYDTTLKDKFDTFITLTLGLLSSVATYFILHYGIKTINYVVISGGLIFAFQAVLLTLSGISRLCQPTKNLLIIDKTTNNLISRTNIFVSKKISLDEIQTVVVSGNKENISVGDGEKMSRIYCSISLKLEGKSDILLFNINTNRFLRTSIQKLETELYSKAKRLTSEINKHLKSKYQWKGFQ